MDPNCLLHQLMVGTPLSIYKEKLRFRHLFVPAARKLLNELPELSICASQWIDYKWGSKYSESQSELRLFYQKPTRPFDMGLSRPASLTTSSPTSEEDLP